MSSLPHFDCLEYMGNIWGRLKNRRTGFQTTF